MSFARQKFAYYIMDAVASQTAASPVEPPAQDPLVDEPPAKKPRFGGEAKDLLKCPCCLKAHAGLKIFICSNGHNICEKCSQEKTKGHCFVCKLPVISPAVRNLAMESCIEASGSSFVCLSQGCSEESPSSSGLADHETKCNKRLVPCPAGVSCQDIQIGMMQKHISEMHPTMRQHPLGDGKLIIKCKLGVDDIPSPVLITFRDQDGYLVVSYAKSVGKGTTFLHTWLTLIGDKKRAAEFSARAEVSFGKFVKTSAPCSIFPADIKQQDLALFETNTMHLEPAKKFLGGAKHDFVVILHITQGKESKPTPVNPTIQEIFPLFVTS